MDTIPEITEIDTVSEHPPITSIQVSGPNIKRDVVANILASSDGSTIEITVEGLAPLGKDKKLWQQLIIRAIPHGMRKLL